MGRVAVGHRERVEIKSFSLGPLPEQFPIVTTGVDRRYQTPGHGRMECLRSQQSSKRLVRENQSRATDSLEQDVWRTAGTGGIQFDRDPAFDIFDRHQWSQLGTAQAAGRG